MSDLNELNELALEENNQLIITEVLENIINLKKLAKKNETKCFLSNETDSLDCYIEIDNVLKKDINERLKNKNILRFY